MEAKKQTKKRTGFTDRRARRLIGNGVATGLAAVLPLLGVAAYRVTAPELGRYGWTILAIVGVLAATSALCMSAAYYMQVVADRQATAAEAIDAAFGDGPVVVAGPVSAAPTHVAASTQPVPAAPAGVNRYAPARPATWPTTATAPPESAVADATNVGTDPEPPTASARVTEPVRQ